MKNAIRLFSRLAELPPRTGEHMCRTASTAVLAYRTLSARTEFQRYTLGGEERLLLLSGRLHDIGKCEWPSEMFREGVYAAEQKRFSRGHLNVGFRMLAGAGLYRPALVMAHHHDYGPERGGYRVHHSLLLRAHTERFTLVEHVAFRRMGVLLMLADWYDACRYRKPIGPADPVSEQICAKFPEHRQALEFLFEQGAFTERDQ